MTRHIACLMFQLLFEEKRFQRTGFIVIYFTLDQINTYLVICFLNFIS